MPQSKHRNNGECLYCVEIRDRFPNFNADLWSWFAMMQKIIPDFHISCAGRGQRDQELLYMKGASRAHWTWSAHNWGAGLDTFFMCDLNNLWPRKRYDALSLGLPPTITWYGKIGSVFPELPHFELRNWRALKDQGLLTLCVSPSNK